MLAVGPGHGEGDVSHLPAVVAVAELVAAAALRGVWTAAAGAGQTVVVAADGGLAVVLV